MRKQISSINNPLIKETSELRIKKYRNINNAFIVEGMRSTEEVLNSGWDILRAFVDISIGSERLNETADKLEALGIPVLAVTTDVMQKISDTDTPQGILAVVRRKKIELREFEHLDNGLLLVLDEIRDPGNLGTIIRTADAAGISGIILLEGCADLYAPKTVRATMGSVFHLPIKNEQGKPDFIKWCADNNWSIWSTSLEGGNSIYNEEVKKKTVVVMGNEAEGVSPDFLLASEKRIYIPMQGKAESLNVAVATGIILFECARRRLVTKLSGMI